MSRSSRKHTPRPKGFQALDPARLRAIGSSGGHAAHKGGRAHRWTSEEARVAGRKGGLARRKLGLEIEESDAEEG